MSEQTSKGHDVFISYSRDHALAQAGALRDALLAREPVIRAFKDDAGLKPGEQWLQRLANELAGCPRFVVLLGPEGLSRWVGGEVSQILTRFFGVRATSEQPVIIPVLMGDTPPTVLGGWLGQFQSLHWPAGQADPPAALLDALRTAMPATSARLLPEFDGQCPFVGLEALQADKASLFFGRESDLLTSLGSLGERQPLPPQTGRPPPTPDYQCWLSIEGASGSGKSSLLRAGLLPLVVQGALSARTGLDDWAVVGPWLPGDAPLTELAKALGTALLPPEQMDSQALRQRLGHGTAPDTLSLWLHDRLAHTPQRGVLIAIDQFEELFTLTPEAERQRLDALLAHSLAQADGRVLLVSTCRSDYAHRIVEELPGLGALKQDRQRCATRALAPLDRAAMTRAIQGPARLCGLDVSQVLPAVLEDARDDMAGALPLVQQALRTVWEAEQHPDGQGRPGQSPVRELRLATYDRLGRLAGTLGSQADAVLARLRQQSASHEKGALELLLALAHWQPDGRHTRQHLPLDAARRQAGLGDEARGEAVLNALSPHHGTIRLVVVSGEPPHPRVDLIHEALLRSRPGPPPTPYWKTLLDYLEQHRDRQHLRDGLRLQALAWQQRGAGRKGTASYGELRRLRPLQPLANDLEQRFLKASYWPARLSLLGMGVGALGVLLGAVLGSQADWQDLSRRLAATPAAVQVMDWLHPIPSDKLLPEAIEIPLGRFTYGCKVGRDGESCPGNELDPDSDGQVDMATLPGVCTAFAATEVTFGQYDHYVRSVRASGPLAPGQAPPDHPKGVGWGWQRDRLHPVVNVSWHEAVAYAQWLSHVTKQIWRLPAEVEWEYAARAEHPSRPGGQPGSYWWGKESPKTKRTADGGAMANCEGCGPGTGQGTVAVASYAPNPFGLHDTVGNVWEWTASSYDSENKPAPDEDGDRNASALRVLRGGSWFNAAGHARASLRGNGPPDSRDNLIGFRLCRASPIEPPAAGAAVR